MDALPAVITENLEGIRALCVKYHVKRLTLFGSAAKGRFNPRKSDVDLVVEFDWHPDPLERGRRYNELWDNLRDILGRKVDLLVASTITNPYLVEAIRESHRDLYDAA
jgi:predicted nucleotidyltransferase